MRRNDGFTLVEILLVVVIITILAAVAVPRFVGRGEQARVAAAQSDVSSNIAVALDMFEVDNGFYPTTNQGLAALVEKPTSAPTPQRWNGPYLKGGLPKDPWRRSYVYRCPGNEKRDYDLLSLGPDGVEGTEDDITNWESESEEAQAG